MRPLRASVFAVLLFAAVAPAARQTAAPARGEASVSAARVRAHIEFLADDLLEGREAGTRGYDLAARYAASVLKASGYEPAGDAGTFFQQVPFIESTATATAMRVTANGATTDIRLPDEGLVSPHASLPEAAVTAPVVFAGFGVTAPELKYDDYAGLDAKEKIVAILFNAPPKFPSEPRAHYASPDVKLKNAADHGAVAVVALMSPDDLKQFPWELVAAFFGRPQLTWARPDGTPGTGEQRLNAVAFLAPQGAERLFAAAPLTFTAAVEAGRNSTPRPTTLNATLTLSSSTTHRRVSSANVAGRLPGGDPKLAATSVVLTAHLDHIGVVPETRMPQPPAAASEGAAGAVDRINNGAYDNATGSAILLEVARALAAAAARPKRSVLAVLVTAEEKGLLGSDYFARHPGRAAGKMVANVNLDMPTFLTDTRDLVAFGAENSTLALVARRAAGSAGYTLSPDPMPEENIFVRSDQYSFVKQGVPAVYLMPGFTARDPKVEGGQVFRDFLATHYHRPSDDLSRPMDLAAVERFTRVNLAIARAIADDPVAPSWKPGNFFGRTFAGGK